ncbi:MAG: sulfurtransferase TusA family protein [Sedimenticola sp.]|nr:sulfurtransferase TusA family protein [Sedimenticola sp.]MCW8882805.1 sulfurtransferase TusA family protein [Sedimenticola sp.]MCW8946300.1 sulfurtransferase TusA family protein [Sedimenticola sp.]MCW8975708.1 sulfurtransferase TusA family protein [Sedimenticola sp.]MDF1529505.1 sulfurtransferase TusA family protein [Sedimenticola sp.]
MTLTIEEIRSDQQLDVSGFICPLPVLKTKAALSRMSAGEVLKVTVTHPDSRKEFPVLCRLPEFELLASSEEDGNFFYWIKKVSGGKVG